ncbi:MAG: hypothetical protein AB1918_15890 [Pseudomonadota bacterium]
MKRALIAFTGVAIAASASAQQPAPQPISSATDIFAIIDGHDSQGQALNIHLVNSAMSPDGSTILFPGDRVSAVIEPLKPGNTRQAVCVTAIDGREGKGQVVPIRPALPREGCLAQLHDYEGAAGLPATDIRVGLPVRVRLNGDLFLTGRKR